MSNLMIHVVEEGGRLHQGLNVYPPGDSSSFGGRLIVGEALIRFRYSKRRNKWHFGAHHQPVKAA